MNNAIIACEMLRDEIRYAMTQTDCIFPIHWLEAGLHNTPKLLSDHLQHTVNSLRGHGYDTVILTFGSCGNALLGLQNGNFKMVIPRVDDCISLLLGSVERKATINHCAGTCFLTPGWIIGERNIWAEYHQAIEKYGKRRADRIMNTMLHNYRDLALLDTNCYQTDDYWLQVERMAADLKLNPRLLPASTTYLEELLLGPWPAERFIIIPPNERITEFPLSV